MQEQNPYSAPQSSVEMSASPISEKIKVYSPTQAAIGTFLCGSLGTVYFLASNYKSIGNKDAYRKTIIIGVPSVIILLAGALILLPRTVIPIGIFSIFLTGYLVGKLQFTKAQIEKSSMLTIRSGLSVILNSLLCLACLVVFIFAISMILAIFGYGKTT